EALEDLLAFDIALYRQKIEEELQGLGVDSYVTGEAQVSPLGEAMSGFAAGSAVPTPKFISLLRRAKDLAADPQAPDHVKPYANLDLDNLSKQNPGPNLCAIGLL